MASRRGRNPPSKLPEKHSKDEHSSPQPLTAASVPYQPKVFQDFIALLGRIFYDDGCIILLDFLAREQRAFSEADLRERLRWREALLHQKLYTLEKQLLIERTTEAEKGTKTIQLWRLQCHCFISVDWRLKELENNLQAELKKASRQSDFQCSNPACKTRVSLLDAAAGPRALEDDHPLCRQCGFRLTTADSEEAKSFAEDRLRRAHEQLLPLKDALHRVRGMVIPAFGSTVSQPPEQAQLEELQPKAAPPPISTPVNLPPSSRDIPWFPGTPAGGAPPTNVPNIRHVPVSLGQEQSALPTRITFGTGQPTPTFGQAGLVKPGAFRPMSISHPIANPPSLDTSSASLAGSAASGARPATAERSPLKLQFGTTTTSKPFSLTLKAKGSDGQNSAVGSLVGSTSNSDTGSKRKPGEDVFAAFSKRVKF